MVDPESVTYTNGDPFRMYGTEVGILEERYQKILCGLLQCANGSRLKPIDLPRLDFQVMVLYPFKEPFSALRVRVRFRIPEKDKSCRKISHVLKLQSLLKPFQLEKVGRISSSNTPFAHKFSDYHLLWLALVSRNLMLMGNGC